MPIERYVPDNSSLFSMIGTKIGRLHNQSVISYIEEIGQPTDVESMLNELEELTNIGSLFESSDSVQWIKDELNLYLSGDINMLEYLSPLVNDIIEQCEDNFTLLSQQDRLTYVTEVCQYVNSVSENSYLESECFTINATLSTLYCSSLLWRLAVPEITSTPTIAININQFEDWNQIVEISSFENSEDYLLGEPVFYGEQIDRLFFFSEMPLDGNISNLLSLVNDNSDITIPSPIVFSYNDITICLPAGVYPLSISDDGYAACLFLSESARMTE